MFCANFSILANYINYIIINVTHLFHLSRLTGLVSFVFNILSTNLMNFNQDSSRSVHRNAIQLAQRYLRTVVSWLHLNLSRKINNQQYFCSLIKSYQTMTFFSLGDINHGSFLSVSLVLSE